MSTDLMPERITIGVKYGPAMEITDQAEADAYFERCVQHTMQRFDKTREEAELIERSNLGYYAGYCSPETRERVERLFKCAHPIFGAIATNGSPSLEHALRAGIEAGTKGRGERR
jgi:hypothetical protein